jgi:hypothetical protein
MRFVRLTAMRFEAAVAFLLVSLAVSSPSAAGQGKPLDALVERTFHVSARGEIAFAAVSAGLLITDLSRPSEPRALFVLPLPQSGTFTLPSGAGIVWLAQGPAGIYAVDAADPANPVVISRTDTPGSAMMAALSGTLLAVADGSAGVRLFDAGDPRSPKPRGALRLDGYCRGVAFHRSTLYACAGAAGLVAIDASAADTPRVIAACATAGDARDVAFENATAVVADGARGLSVVDLSDPAAPRLFQTRAVPDFAHGVAAAKGFVYAAEGAAGIGVYRRAAAGSLELVHRAATGAGYANKVTVVGKRLLVANDAEGIAVFDIADPARPSPAR